MYKHSHSNHIILRSLDGTGESKLGYPLKQNVRWMMQFVWGYFTRLLRTVCRNVIKSKPYAKTPGGRIRLSAVDELGHSLEAQMKPGAAE